MPDITLIAAAPFDEVSGVALDDITLPVLFATPVQVWIVEHAGYDIYVAGSDDPVPEHGRTLDIPLDEVEYREFLDAVDLAKEG